jgi:HK97 family phage prohead protease
VQRGYGVERLRISKDAIDRSRVREGGVPVLNSHNATDIRNVLGRIVTTWIKDGALWGRIAFAETPNGILAEEMVSRGELRSVSAGYDVERWSVTDADGNPIDPENVWRGENPVFTAERWTLIEVSFVATPADQKAMIRSVAVRLCGKCTSANDGAIEDITAQVGILRWTASLLPLARLDNVKGRLSQKDVPKPMIFGSPITRPPTV